MDGQPTVRNRMRTWRSPDEAEAVFRRWSWRCARRHAIAEHLRAMVYMDPNDYDRPAIRSELEKIRREHPNLVQCLIQPAFERLVENSGDDSDTQMVDLFLRYGASVSNPTLFSKAVQILDGCRPHEPKVTSQVNAVLRALITAGADPTIGHAEFEGRSIIQEFSKERWRPTKVQAIQRVFKEIEQDRSLEMNTAPATGPSRRQGRL